MSLSYMIEKLEEEHDIQERLKLVPKLFNSFQHILPEGRVNPPAPDGAYTKSDQSISEGLDADHRFFCRIAELCGGNFPKSVLETYAKFDKNKGHARKLLNIPWEERKDLPLSEFFPYWPDFDREIKKQLSINCLDVLPVEDITFNTRPFKKGGFSHLHKGTGLSKKQYALKIFTPDSFLTRMDEVKMRWWRDVIQQNLHENKDFLMDSPFVHLRVLPYRNRGAISCYLMDFFPGSDVEEFLSKGKMKNREDMSRAARTYLRAMVKLHENGRLMLDNKWSSVLINSFDVALCDYDFITRKDCLDRYISAYSKQYPHTPMYASQEKLVAGMVPGFSSDVEEVLLMLDHLYVGKPILVETKDMLKRYDEARDDKREYPLNRRKLLPKNLREIVTEGVSYPRAEGITAKDVLEAVEKEYRDVLTKT